MLKTALRSGLIALVLAAGLARAEQPWTFDNNTRYLALGDSLAAGYGAMPGTNGYTYILYREGVYDKISNTLFANAAVPGATSRDVLDHQLPQVPRFPPHVVTLSVGGNDLLAVLAGGDPGVILPALFNNLGAILFKLCTEVAPGARIYIGNLYTIRDFPVSTDELVAFFNGNLALIVAGANATFCANNVGIADVFTAFGGFDGPQQGLLLVNRTGAGALEVHPSNAGYRAMAAAYKAAHSQ